MRASRPILTAIVAGAAFWLWSDTGAAQGAGRSGAPAGDVQASQGPGSWEGTYEEVIADADDFRSHRRIRTVDTGTERLAVEFADDGPGGLKTGDRIRVSGVRSGSVVAAYGGGVTKSAAKAPPTPPCTTLGPQSSIVLLVTMPGVAPPPDVNVADVADMFFGALLPSPLISLTDFWRENSYGATTAVGSIAPGPNGGWYTLDQAYSDDQRAEIRAAAIRAADADVAFTQYRRIFLVINGMPVTNNYAGWGTIGCGTLSSADGNFTASTSWMRAASFTTNLRGTHLAAHEGGHNLGLQHSNSRDFDTQALGAPGAAGVVDEYDDAFANMGRGFGHYAAPHKVALGWLTSQAVTVTTNGSFVVQPMEFTGATVQALKIRRGTDNANWIWLEYRQPAGLYDSKLAAPFVFGLANPLPYLDASLSHIYSGGLLHYQDATTGAYSHLLDMTPGSLATSGSTLLPDDWLDPALSGTWVDPYTGLSITTSNPTASGLTVDIVYGPLGCAAAAPTVTLSPSSANAKRGQAVSFTVSVRNNDSAGCSAKVFDMSSSLPSGWASSVPSQTAGIAPGAIGSVSLTKTVPSTAALTSYTVDATAASGGLSASSSASVTVRNGK